MTATTMMKLNTVLLPLLFLLLVVVLVSLRGRERERGDVVASAGRGGGGGGVRHRREHRLRFFLTCCCCCCCCCCTCVCVVSFFVVVVLYYAIVWILLFSRVPALCFKNKRIPKIKVLIPIARRWCVGGAYIICGESAVFVARKKEKERERERVRVCARARKERERERERKKERKKERVGMKVYKSTHNNNTVNNVAAAPNVKGGKNATTSTTPTGTLRGYWKAEEETALRAAVQKHGIGAWEKMRTDPDFKALRYVFVVGDVALAAACAFNIALVVGRSLVQKNHHHQKISFFDFFFCLFLRLKHILSLFHTHTKHKTQNTHTHTHTEEELECN